MNLIAMWQSPQVQMFFCIRTGGPKGTVSSPYATGNFLQGYRRPHSLYSPTLLIVFAFQEHNLSASLVPPAFPASHMSHLS
ncbi:hypothetical protein CDL12_17394 [Handroanthus impetiginosus]|uniref:Uncharacterized protein n=1 Tax=Handroanthus impetiginosus TaxID=429701 RepID=A0A2G9GXN6_9LAMI|nr:hypothetical protein CDL12_17394 [Handroanthus impetiginosus]